MGEAITTETEEMVAYFDSRTNTMKFLTSIGITIYFALSIITFLTITFSRYSYSYDFIYKVYLPNLKTNILGIINFFLFMVTIILIALLIRKEYKNYVLTEDADPIKNIIIILLLITVLNIIIRLIVMVISVTSYHEFLPPLPPIIPIFDEIELLRANIGLLILLLIAVLINILLGICFIVLSNLIKRLPVMRNQSRAFLVFGITFLISILLGALYVLFHRMVLQFDGISYFISGLGYIIILVCLSAYVLIGINIGFEAYYNNHYGKLLYSVTTPSYPSTETKIGGTANISANYGVYSSKSGITTLLLCLFAGGLGAHRFYAGKIGTGILWLFTGGLMGIGSLVDLILLLTGKFTDDEGKIIKI